MPLSLSHSLSRATAGIVLLAAIGAPVPGSADDGPGSAGGAPERAPRNAITDVFGLDAGDAAAVSRRDLLARPLNADHDDDYLYRLPYADGVSYSILQGYGAKLSHRGPEYFTLDFRMDEGTVVHSAREGTVVLVEDSFNESCWAEGCGRYANFVVILHEDGTTGEYFHLQRGSVLVAPGDFVERGAPIARSGNTGYSNAPHLHFGVYRGTPDGKAQSIAVRFATRLGVVAPRSGARYQNVVEQGESLAPSGAQ